MSSVRMMVSSGLAGAHVQPCPRNKIELRATSCELGAISKLVRSKLIARSSKVWHWAPGSFRWRTGPV